jgi:hypothetical protein
MSDGSQQDHRKISNQKYTNVEAWAADMVPVFDNAIVWNRLEKPTGSIDTFLKMRDMPKEEHPSTEREGMRD